MTAPSIIQPLKPDGDGWIDLGTLPQQVSMGYAANGWSYEQTFLVISAVESVTPELGEIDKGVEYHISISKDVNGKKSRADSNECEWILEQFGLAGSEEDNHVPHGFVRNFWRPVADNLVGLECSCKDNEPAIRENKGDFIWRPI